MFFHQSSFSIVNFSEMYFVSINFRNRLIEIHKYQLPIKKSTKGVDFMALTKQQIKHIRDNRTTELPPDMFLEMTTRVKIIKHRQGRRRVTTTTKTEITSVKFSGFTLRKTFNQNICLMVDGSVVFCDEFLPPSTVTGGDEDDDDGGRPYISGFKFRKVSFRFSQY